MDRGGENVKWKPLGYPAMMRSAMTDRWSNRWANPNDGAFVVADGASYGLNSSFGNLGNLNGGSGARITKSLAL